MSTQYRVVKSPLWGYYVQRKYRVTSMGFFVNTYETWVTVSWVMTIQKALKEKEELEATP